MTLAFDTTPIAEPPTGLLETRVVPPAQALEPSLRSAFVGGRGTEPSLDALFDGGALCVTTGQQPGLFLGPLFTVYKAVTAIALARRLSTQLKRPVVPVFWVAGDDHDFAEANHFHIVNLNNEITEIRLRGRDPDAPSLPLYREPVGMDVDAVLAALETETPPTEFRDQVLTWIRRHYQPEQDMATAFAGALAELLSPHGLLVFRPTDSSAKRAMAPRLLQALEHAVALDRALAERRRELERGGHPVPVSVGDQATTVMIEVSLGRDRLIIDGNHFVARRSQETWTFRQLEAIAQTEPERLSPNVLLRPVIEAALLPTVAYVAGPGELAYSPQCAPVYDRLGVEPQPFVPRWSARILEAKITKVLEKFGIDPDQLAQEGQVEGQLMREEMPPEAAAALRTLRQTVQAEFARLEREVMAIDPTLKKAIAAQRNSQLGGIADVEKRLVSHLKKQSEILVQQVTKARNHLFPLGRPQERVFNVVPYLIRYGTSFVDSALATADEWCGSLESVRHGP